MDWDSPAFVIVIVAMVMVTVLVATWIESRARAGKAAAIAKAGRKAELLEQENAQLKDQVGRLEERLAVLERIATDPAERTARQIDELR